MRKDKQSTYWFSNVICAVLFCAFTFLYLYFFQGDVMAYTQHVLSGGLTRYNPLVGAVICTSILMIATVFTSLFTRRHMYFLPSLYCLPSALMLAAVTDVRIVEWGSDSVFGSKWIACVAVFVLFVVFYRMLKRFILPGAIMGLLPVMRNLSLNLGLLLIICSFVVWAGNTDERTHLRLHTEYLLNNNRYSEAANTGKTFQLNDEAVLTTRAYAMAKNGRIGEEFFENIMSSNSECLLPNAENPLLLFPADRIYKMLGGVKMADMSVNEYLRLLHKRHQLKEGGRDYLYISALLDRDLDKFVEYYSERYDSTTVVPKHYREALTLYNHLHTNPVIDYSVPEMEADYADFQALMKKNTDKTLKQNALRSTYGNTYWYYFNCSSF